MTGLSRRAALRPGLAGHPDRRLPQPHRCHPRLHDLYLERRLELKLTTLAGSAHARRAAPMVPRRAGATRRGPRSRADRHLAAGARGSALPARQADRPAAGAAPARRDRAAAGVARLGAGDAGRARRGHCTVRYLARRAVVVGPERWTAVSCRRWCASSWMASRRPRCSPCGGTRSSSPGCPSCRAASARAGVRIRPQVPVLLRSGTAGCCSTS